MLPRTHKISYSFFDVGGGDAIWVRFLGNDTKWHNILVDGGFGFTYKNAFGPLINEIVNEGECIDLWIVTHIDRDHIGAVIGFTRDKKINVKNSAVKQFWFNHSDLTVNQGNGKLSVSDGIKFRDFLEENGLLVTEAITVETQPVDFFGLKLTILSPTKQKLNNADKLWNEEEKIGKIGRTAGESDHGKTIPDLQLNNFVGDTDPINGSSISLLCEVDGIKALLLADSHPSDIEDSIKRIGFSDVNPMEVSLIQLAHHGSKANTSPKLLQIIKASIYVITGNGITNRHPDKETLVRILTNARRNDNRVQFLFTSDTNELRNLFSVDEQPYERFNFSCVYARSDSNMLTLDFLPFKDIMNE